MEKWAFRIAKDFAWIFFFNLYSQCQMAIISIINSFSNYLLSLLLNVMQVLVMIHQWIKQAMISALIDLTFYEKTVFGKRLDIEGVWNKFQILMTLYFV